MGCASPSRATDTSGGSSYVNRDPGYLEGGDREIPHIGAPYTSLREPLAVGPFPEAPLKGTSLSTPIVAGAAALVIEANNSLQGRPEALRAVLLASADTNPDLASYPDPQSG